MSPDGEAAPSTAFQEVLRALSVRLGESQTAPKAVEPSYSWHIQRVRQPAPEVESQREVGEQLTMEQKAAIQGCIEKALDVMGRTGKEVFFEILSSRYGLAREDITSSPGRFMTTLKILMEDSARILESYALEEIQTRLGVSASTLEEAVGKVEAGNRACSLLGKPERRSGTISRESISVSQERRAPRL